VLLLQELGKLGVVAGGHGGLAGSPGGGANLAVDVGVLEGLNEAEGLVDGAADGEVVHGDVAEDALVIDDVGGAEGNAGVLALLNEAAVVAGDLVGDVGEEGHLHGANATLGAGLLGVLHVGEVAVDGAADDLGADLLELGGLVGELADLGGAHEGEIEGPEEEHGVLALEVIKGDLLELVVPPGLPSEGGGGLADDGFGGVRAD